MNAMDRLNGALEGRYRITRELGEGGMSTVYLADDLRHGRSVALKVLRPALAAVVGADRFLSEIRTTAKLQHPHILPLFDSGEADGFLYYVMPFVRGETLRERLDRERQLGVEEAVALTRKVARALDHAHQNGVVHRDVKPGNILLSEQGEPLVADFGIAVAVAQAGGDRLTETGLSLGTPHYMSPEQAAGDRTVGIRSDVYALGCVLYEALAGEPPFTGPTAQVVLVKIVTADPPDVTLARRTVPPNVSAALAKSLEKLPADRFSTAERFSAALGDAAFRYRPRAAEPPSAGSVATPPSRRSLSRAALPATAAVAVVALALAAWGWMRPESHSGPVTRATIDTGDLPPLSPLGEVLVSPDGTRIALVGFLGPIPIQWRPADAEDFLSIPGTEDAEYAAFSPDGRALVFGTESSGTVQRVDLGGGAPRAVARLSTPDLGGIDWGDDDTVVFTGSGGLGLFSVPADGGDPVRILPDSVRLRNPKLLPGGRAVIYTGFSVGTNMVDLETGAVRSVRPGAIDAQYVDTGHLLYADAAGTLWGVAFDPDRGVVLGEAVALFDGLARPTNYYARFSASRTGTLVYATGPVQTRSGSRNTASIVRLDGNIQRLDIDLREARPGAVWSPDGTSILYGAPGPRGGDAHIWIYDLELGTEPRQLTFVGDNAYPVISPDGGRVAFSSLREGTDEADLFVKSLNDDTAPRPLLTHPGDQAATQWPTDSLILLESGSPSALLILDLSDPAEPHLTDYLRPGREDLWGVQLSPDRGLAVYHTDEQGPRNEHVYLRRFPVPGAPTRVDVAGGFGPRWSRDGNTVYYWALTGYRGTEFTAARIARDPTPIVSSRQALFMGNGEDFAIHPDGDRLLMIHEAEDSTAAEPERLIVVTNWFGELEALMRR